MKNLKLAELPTYPFDLGSHWKLIEVEGERFIERLDTPQLTTEAVAYPGSPNPAYNTPSSEYLTYKNRSIGVPPGDGSVSVDEEVEDEDDVLLDSMFTEDQEEDEEKNGDIGGSSAGGRMGPPTVGQPLSSWGK